MKKKIVSILIIIALVGGITLTSYAVENKVESKQETNTTNSSSSNANLKNLGIKPYDFTGFKPSKTAYSVTVPEDTTTVEVYAQTQDSSAKVTGTGTVQLESGENKVNIVVTAKNGTIKTYTIKITKEVANEDESVNIDDNKENEDGLKSLTIEGATITPEFKTDIYEYKAKYIGEKEELDIKVEPTNNTYYTEIIGNTGIKDGENTVTILVSDSEGKNIATYQVTVNKSIVDEEAIALEKGKKKKIIIGGVAGLVVLLIIIIIIKRIRNRDYEDYYDDYDEDEYEGEDDYYEDDETKEVEITEKYDSKRNEEKQKIREKFLDEYNKEINYDNEKTHRRKGKGKRFK